MSQVSKQKMQFVYGSEILIVQIQVMSHSVSTTSDKQISFCPFAMWLKIALEVEANQKRRVKCSLNLAQDFFSVIYIGSCSI